MGTILKWYIIAVVVAVPVLGVASAAALNGTLVHTGGNAGGIILGGVPQLGGSFQEGLHAYDKKKSGAGVTSWTGPATSWNGAQTAPARQHRAPHVAPAAQHKAPKPNA